MADDKKESKVTLEREYNIPLRRWFVNIPKYQRTKKAVRTVKEFIAKHMKTENVLMGKHLNLLLWKHGWKNPPHHVSVVTKKYDDGKATVELKGAPAEEVKAEKAEKKEAKKDAPVVKEAEVVKEEKKEAKTEAKAASEKPKKAAKPKAEKKE
jgi:large subunit ribosomal protein L31e